MERKWDLNHFRTGMIELPGHFAAINNYGTA